MRIHRSFTSLLLAGATAVGCAGAGDGTGDLPDQKDTLAYMQTHGTLIPDSGERTEKAASFMIKATTESGATGPNVSTHFCAMSTLKGDFSYNGEAFTPRVTIGLGSDGTWQFSDHLAVGAAICTAWSNFQRPAGSVNWLSDESRIARWDNGESVGNIWFGDAMTYLTEVAGELEGAGESIFINQSSSATSPTSFHVRTQHAGTLDSTFIRGGARSVFVNVPASGRLVKVWGYRDGSLSRGDLSLSGTWRFSVGGDSGFSTYWLARFDDALCHLTRVSGNLDGSGDGVSITQNGAQWFLKAVGNGAAWARCMAYDQR